MGQTRPLGEIYAETRHRIAELLLGASESQLATMLPTCPEWSVRDVVGHMIGLLDDVLVGRLEGAGTPEWTAAQVDAVRGLDVAAALRLWERWAVPAERDFHAALGPFAPRLVSDVWNHEQDIRHALRLPVAHRDSDAVAAALTAQMEMLTTRLDGAGLPALRMLAPDGEWRAGRDGPAATVRLDSQAELLRVLLGRRSRAQIAALDWQVEDLDAYLAAFPRFEPAEHDIHE